MKKTLLFTIWLLSGWLTSSAQNLSNRGREFWVGYGHHQFMEPGQSNSQEMVLYFSAEEPANVTVTINGTAWVRNYSIPANTVIASEYLPKNGVNDCRLYSVPPSFGGTGGEGLFNRGIHIVSDVPIVAYAHIFGSASSGATMLMPVETWGYSYASINSQQNYGSNNCFSWLYVVAEEDNTVIEITPSVLTRNGRPAGVPFTATLNRGEIYQVIGASLTASSGRELTGTRVRSIDNGTGNCYPVAVFAGSSRTAITCPTGGSGSGDNIMQQIFPFQAWGKRYLTAPFSHQNNPSQFNGGIIRVAVKDPTTVVRRNGTVLTGLTGNFYYQFQSNTADLIEADGPILVAQYMPSTGQCGYSGTGDPEMIYLSPVEQSIRRIGFFRNNEENIGVNYLTLIVPNGGTGLSSLRIDGLPLSAIPAASLHTYPHPRSAAHTVVVRRWTTAVPPAAPPGQTIVEGDSAFTAITYGLGSVESYGYNAGTLINNLNAISSLYNTLDPTTTEHAFTCTNTPVQISVLMAYQPNRIDWQLSQLGALVTPNADITDMAPVSTGTQVVNGVTYYKYSLPGTYLFSVADTFYLPIRGYHPSIENCYNRENLSIPIVVKQKPQADFSFTHSGCTLDPVNFSGNLATSNNYNINQFNWTFPGPVTQTGQNQQITLPPGTHPISLNVVSAEGCVGDTVKNITVYDKPPAQFEISPLIVCEGSQLTITDTASVNASIAVNEWYWDLGNGHVETVTSGASISYTYPVFGNYTIKHVSKSSATCVSDTVAQAIRIYAKPTFDNVVVPSGCLENTGEASFAATVSTPDAQGIQSYLWNFGDPNFTSANPNTSNQPNAIHFYQQGAYTVNLQVTSLEGSCVRDTNLNLTLNLKPLLDFPVPAAGTLCENNNPINIAFAAVTNGVPGTGIYKGPGTSSTGTFDPRIAGPGSHDIWYVFTSTAGCVDSISQTYQVSARPRVNFNIPAGGCLPTDGQVQFLDATTISDGQPLTGYAWNFGDPNASGTNPNTSNLPNPIHLYGEGSYTISLTVTSQLGCVADTTIDASFALRPLLSYAALPPVCEDINTISVASAAVNNAVTGAGIYKGPGTQDNGDFSPRTAGAGTHTIWYIYTTNGGCVDSVSTTILVHPKPNAQFSVTTDICLDQSATITDASAISSGNITSWSWDFGDGNTATYANGNSFNINYTAFDTYTIRLTTTSDNGCISDMVTENIAVHAIPAAAFDLPASICLPGGAANFVNRSTVGDNAPLTYIWNFGDGNTSTTTNPSHVYATGGVYPVSLTVTSGFGCTNTNSQPLASFFNKPQAQFAVSPDTLCQGTDNVFTDQSVDGTSTISSWNWTFADGTTSNQQNPVKRYNLPGNYNVVLTVTNQAGCVSDPFISPVIVYLQPVIDAGPSFVVPEGTTIRFEPTVNDSTIQFVWNPAGDFADPTVLRPSLVASRDQLYTLTATGLGNCSATDQLEVKILKLVNVPNAFSPNGDGINDRWDLSNLSDYPGATVEIFNRYGQLLYRSQGYANPWDGTYKGSPLPVATYYYVITLKNGFKPITGSVTIVR